MLSKVYFQYLFLLFLACYIVGWKPGPEPQKKFRAASSANKVASSGFLKTILKK
jgi:hypothetical protein